MAQIVFLQFANPSLRIIHPETGEVIQFLAGRLVMEEDDPNLEVVQRVAASDPSMSVQTVDVSCPDCGAVFTGKIARADLGKHRKRAHPSANPDLQGTSATQVKGSANFVCTVCNPAQTFPDEGALMAHNTALHAPLKIKQEEIDNQGDNS